MAWLKSKQDSLADNLYDEQVHGTVASEIAAGDLVHGLWAKAFAQADGNEQRAKAIYIKLRVEQIKLGNAAQAEHAREAESLSTSKAKSSPPPKKESQCQYPPNTPFGDTERKKQYEPIIPGHPILSFLVVVLGALGGYLLKEWFP